jgi:hypothetical protein
VKSPCNEALPILENPFFHRGPIRDRRYFFGRTRETRRAFQMLRNSQCVSIVGPRRVGETSLLFHLCDPAVQERHGLGEEYLFVYIDCQGMGNLDKPRFYRAVWVGIQRALVERGEADCLAEIMPGWDVRGGHAIDTTSMETAGGRPLHGRSLPDFNGLRSAVTAIRERGYKLTFLFDEFEVAAQNHNLDKDLFSDLRSLVPAVVYVTASQDSLYDLTYPDRGVLSSPFFNIFEEIRLGLMRRGEAEEMVGGLLGMTGAAELFTREGLAFVFEVGGYYPFFLQLACYHLFEQKMERGELTAADYERVRQRFAEDAEPHFRYAWKNLDVGEQEAARLVCDGGIGQLDGDRKRRLERKCILYGDGFFSSVFTEFVRRQMAGTGAGEADEMNPRRTPIFLSYAREDGERVADLYERLSDEGFKPWMDRKDILPGERWRACVQGAIRASDFFLVCLSAHSVNKRGFIQKEIRDALDICQEMLDSDIYLIPVRLEDCDVPERLRDFQWVDLFERGGWAQLVRAIRVGMERRTEADAA